MGKEGGTILMRIKPFMHMKARIYVGE